MCTPRVDRDCTLPGQAATQAARSFLDGLAEESMKAAGSAVRLVVAGWLNAPTGQVSQTSGAVPYLRAYTWWIVAAVAVGALLIAAARMALDRNGKEAGSLGRGVAVLVVATGAGIPAVAVLTQIGDSYSTWIVNKAADGDFGARISAFAPAAGAASLTGLGAVMLIMLGLFVSLSGFLQVLLLFGRSAGLVLLTGLLPVAAAAGLTGGGRQMRDRYLTWLVSFVLYKPAAATVYAAAFWLVGKGQDVNSVIVGLVTFCMALAALPALMRLIAPAVAVITSGGGGGGAGLAVAGAGGQLASGAIQRSSVPTTPSICCRRAAPVRRRRWWRH